MALYELYEGGVRHQNTDFAMYPSAPFSQSSRTIYPSDNQPSAYAPSRSLDFTGINQSLNTFLADNPVVTGDTLSAIIIPSQSLLKGIRWRVLAPLTGVSFSLVLRNAAVTVLTGQSGAVLSSGWAPFETAGVWDPRFLTADDILDVVFTAVPAEGLSGFSLAVNASLDFFTERTF